MFEFCKPSQYYFLFSIVGLILMITFNVITGSKCGKISNTYTFMTQLFYILFWSWLLNKICEKGYSKFSWFLFLVPIVTSTVFATIIMKTLILGENIYEIVDEEKKKEEEKDKGEGEGEGEGDISETFSNFLKGRVKR
mgnify:CR=1 FL=1